MTVKITYEEWVTALDKINQPSKDAMLVQEWAKILGVSLATAREWIRTGLRAGWMKQAYVMRERLNGVCHKIVGYHILEKRK